MSRTIATAGKIALLLGAATLAAMAGSAALASPQKQETPKDWNYDIQNGKRVPKANRVTNADGSWREETKQGKCVTVKERTAAGDYKETRECNPTG